MESYTLILSDTENDGKKWAQDIITTAGGSVEHTQGTIHIYLSSVSHGDTVCPIRGKTKDLEERAA